MCRGNQSFLKLLGLRAKKKSCLRVVERENMDLVGEKEKEKLSDSKFEMIGCG